MKARFEIEFEDPATAKKAASALSQNVPSTKASLKCKAQGKTLKAIVEAKTFSSLRAISTSFLRDAKVFTDAVKLSPKGTTTNTNVSTKSSSRKR